MDKFIEILVEKKSFTIMVTVLTIGVISPGAFLIFTWNREIFNNIHFIKLLLLDVSIGVVFMLLNFIVTFSVKSLTARLFGTEFEIYMEGESDNIAFAVCFIFTCSFFTCMELIILSAIKIIYPDMTMKEVLVTGLSVGQFALLGYWILDIAARIKNRITNKKS